MKHKIVSYKDREQRYLDQIDRFQLLLRYKENSENLSHDTTMTQANDAPRDKIVIYHDFVTVLFSYIKKYLT